MPPAAVPQMPPAAPAVAPPDLLAAQILRRLDAVEAENIALRGQLAQAQAQQPPQPQPQVAQSPQREQATIDTRVLGKPVNGVKDDAQWPIFSRLLKAYLAALDGRYMQLLERCADLGKDVENLELDAEDERLSTHPVRGRFSWAGVSDGGTC